MRMVAGSLILRITAKPWHDTSREQCTSAVTPAILAYMRMSLQRFRSVPINASTLDDLYIFSVRKQRELEIIANLILRNFLFWKIIKRIFNRLVTTFENCLESGNCITIVRSRNGWHFVHFCLCETKSALEHVEKSQKNNIFDRRLKIWGGKWEWGE